MGYAIKHSRDKDEGTSCEWHHILNKGNSQPSCPYKPDDELKIVHPLHVLSLSDRKLIPVMP